MDTSVSQDYYVYTLAYPDGRVFYVGKGRDHLLTYPGVRLFYSRIEIHEKEAMSKSVNTVNKNLRKLETIREIWKSGGQVKKTKVAHFANEVDAYIYEWALINFVYASEYLTNIASSPVYSHEKRVIVNSKPIVKKRIAKEEIKNFEGLRSPDGIEYREIRCMQDFCEEHCLIKEKIYKVIRGELDYHRGWTSIKYHGWIRKYHL